MSILLILLVIYVIINVIQTIAIKQLIKDRKLWFYTALNLSLECINISHFSETISLLNPLHSGPSKQEVAIYSSSLDD